MRKHNDPLWSGVAHNASVSGFVAAYSRADVRRVIAEYTGSPTSDKELREYWSECWGNSMDGIPCERGLWLQFRHGEQPIRVTP